jgi:hypothetical protein
LKPLVSKKGKKMNRFSSITSMIAIAAMALPTVAMAGTYQCGRAAVPAAFTSNGTPRGNWLGQNTSNYNYVKAPGNDVYQHKKLSLTVQTLCLRNGPGGWNLGDRYNDYNGLEDACGSWSQAVAAASAPTNPCPTGYSKSADQGSCIKPATAASTISNGTPRGNWTVQNTANYEYVKVNASQGEDFYRNTGRMRSNVVSTLCKRSGPLGWDLGDRINDYNGEEDACVTHVAAQAAVTVAASCPAGFSYVLKP